MLSNDSIYFLISELCENVCKEVDPHKLLNEAVSNKLKLVSYDILLKKSPSVLSSGSNNTDPLRELSIKLFELRILGKNNYLEEKKCEEFADLLKLFAEEQYFNEDAGKDILTFLAILQNSSQTGICKSQGDGLPKSFERMPLPFTLQSDKYSRRIFNTSESQVIRGFGQIIPFQYFKNPCLPQFLFRTDLNKLANNDAMFKMYQNPSNISKPAVGSITWSPLNTKPFVFNFFSIVPPISCINVKTSSEKLAKQLNVSKLETFEEFSASVNDNKVLSWNWEHLGNYERFRTQHFASESNSVLHLNNLLKQHSAEICSAKIIELDHLINDLKALVIGIQSDTFQHDNYIIFHMLSGVSVNGVTPLVVQSFVSNFLECGTCYKRLQIMTTKPNHKLIYDGFVFKALCSAIEDYLLHFRRIVLSLECKSLIDLHRKLQTAMTQIIALSRTLAIHPDVNSNLKPPMGSQFLSCLYKEISQISQKDIVLLLVYIVKRCCHVFFKRLQKWLFYGLLDDPCNELFIGFVDHYRLYTKYFFDKAYFIRKECVPGFLHGFENQILQCGKYSMLLKVFKPNHPLFDVEYPTISVSLSFEEIQVVAENCGKYLERSREICGKPITVRDVFNKRSEQKREFFKKVFEKSKRNMEKWTDEQKQKASLKSAEKKRRLEEIHIQLQEAKEQKITKREAEIQWESQLLKQNEEIENKRLIQENSKIQKHLQYYQELNANLEKKKKRIKMKLIKDETEDCLGTGKSSSLENVSLPAISIGTAVEEDLASSSGEEDHETIYEDCVSWKEQIDRDFQLEGQEEFAKFIRNEADFLNSNETLLSNNLSDLKQNRNKILGSNLDYYFKDNSENKQVKFPYKIISSLTESQKIKLKISKQEFGYYCDNSISKIADVNLNPTVTITEETSMQKQLRYKAQADPEKNHEQIVQYDLLGDNSNVLDRRALNLELNTERSRNRRRVLESEFHILTGLVNTSYETPMSTTSDSLDDKSEEIAGESTNYNMTKQIPKLTVDIIKAVNLDIEKMNLDVTTAVIERTPECGLNTAGIIARKGFDFIDNSYKLEKYKSVLPISTEEVDGHLKIDLNDNNSNKLLKDISSAYKRSEQLLKSNFKCEPLSPFIALKLPQEKFQTNKEQKILEGKRRQLNCLNTITLTEFLQKSITIPLNVHMGIISNEIMRIFLDDLDIIGHFKSLRNYFFLMDGEFGSFICDDLIAKLENGSSPNELLNYQMLHSILDNALSSSIIGNDKNAENLSFIVTEMPEKFDLYLPSVLDYLSLSYRVTWPVNLILSPETLDQYANIFRYLMKVRRISWILEEAYQMLKQVVKKYGNEILKSPQYRRVQQIRQKFFHFVHSLRNHITSSALQASWKVFKDDLVSARTIEDIYRKHATYIKNVLFFCMLNKKSEKFFCTVEDIFKVSLRFCRDLKARQWKKLPDDEYYTHSRYEKLLSYESEFDKLIKYTIYLGNKIVLRGYQEEIGELMNLINYNYYYVSPVDIEV